MGGLPDLSVSQIVPASLPKIKNTRFIPFYQVEYMSTERASQCTCYPQVVGQGGFPFGGGTVPVMALMRLS